MRSTEVRRYAMLVRVKEFGETHKALFPDSTEGGRAFGAVAEAVAQLSAHAASKMSTAREGKAAKTLARKALVERLDTVVRTSRAIAEQTPGFDDPFRLPRNASDETLLTAGRVFVADAEAAKARFIGHGLPDTFVADLKALVDAFESAVREREAGRAAQTIAQEGIERALLSGLAAVRQLDVIVPNLLAGTPAAISAWEHDRKLQYPRRRNRRSAADPASAEATAARPAASAPQAVGTVTPPPAATPTAAASPTPQPVVAPAEGRHEPAA